MEEFDSQRSEKKILDTCVAKILHATEILLWALLVEPMYFEITLFEIFDGLRSEKTLSPSVASIWHATKIYFWAMLMVPMYLLHLFYRCLIVIDSQRNEKNPTWPMCFQDFAHYYIFLWARLIDPIFLDSPFWRCLIVKEVNKHLAHVLLRFRILLKFFCWLSANVPFKSFLSVFDSQRSEKKISWPMCCPNFACYYKTFCGLCLWIQFTFWKCLIVKKFKKNAYVSLRLHKLLI